jgi:uncharacterized protein (TIGR02996 family)
MDLLGSLLQDIESNPGDETTWLVLADWLLDQGQVEQAELTRLSIVLRRDEEVPARQRKRQEQRLRELVAAGVQLPLPRRRLKLSGRIGLDLVLIPPGTFRMGAPQREPRSEPDERPAHKVSLTKGFWLSAGQVTQRQWSSLMGRYRGEFIGSDLPAEGVSWDECRQFAAELSKRTGQSCRLPTEAEWEYACRGCTGTAFWFGATASSHQANFDGNYPYPETAPKGPWLHRTTPAGTYPANLFGLFDTHGNVWEWCEDWYDDRYYRNAPAVDPAGPASGSRRVLRGGSWYSYSWSCRSAGREAVSPDSGDGHYGCRVAVDA